MRIGALNSIYSNSFILIYDLQMKNTHKFILPSNKPKTGMVSLANSLIYNHYYKTNFSIERMRKDNRLGTVNWALPNGEKQTSKHINYSIIADYIRAHGSFNSKDFNLPRMDCFWLDHSLDMKINFQVTDETGTLGLVSGIPQQQYGKNYPIEPKLAREGSLYTTFQPQLLTRIIKLRTKLIENSELSFTDDWIFDLRSLINDAISLLDITLNQLYIKAQYDKQPNWKFDKDILGARHGRRLNDKLRWVYQISGKTLNIEPEKKNLERLKELRNHLMHFDPPSLVVTVEEATKWLNDLVDVGIILIKIRQTIGVEVSEGLINFILQKEALFNPKVKGELRKSVGIDVTEDYRSSTW